MIPLVVGFQVRCRSWLCAKPFFRGLPISEPEVAAKLLPEATRFRLRPLCSREKGDSYRRSPFSSSILDFGAFSFPDPTVFVSFELSDWWR